MANKHARTDDRDKEMEGDERTKSRIGTVLIVWTVWLDGRLSLGRMHSISRDRICEETQQHIDGASGTMGRATRDYRGRNIVVSTAMGKKAK